MNNQKTNIINSIWLFMILISVVFATFNGKMESLSQSIFDSAKNGVSLAINLIGTMAFWLGLMKIIEEANILSSISKLLKPIMVRLFKGVPENHPAMSAMILNISANMIGLGNAATPFGIKAMEELNKLNTDKTTATAAMCLFVAMNTSSVNLLPVDVIAVKVAANENFPSLIIISALLATIASTTVAILSSKLFEKKYNLQNQNILVENSDNINQKNSNDNSNNNNLLKKSDEQIKNIKLIKKIGILKNIGFGKFLVISLMIAFIIGVFINIINSEEFSFNKILVSTTNYLIPLLVSIIIIVGYFKGVKVYESAVEGAKEGFNIAIKIIPYIVAIFVAIGMLRTSGAVETISNTLQPLTSLIGFPADVLPMALIRPISGSGAFSIMSEIVTNSPNSFSSFLASTMQSSTDTTFYIAALYFGSIGIKKLRYSIYAALLADITAIFASLFICQIIWNIVF
ncbi:spore maturation protein [bacterium]|nr:spore maturation protein [bacterium]